MLASVEELELQQVQEKWNFWKILIQTIHILHLHKNKELKNFQDHKKLEGKIFQDHKVSLSWMNQFVIIIIICKAKVMKS